MCISKLLGAIVGWFDDVAFAVVRAHDEPLVPLARELSPLNFDVEVWVVVTEHWRMGLLPIRYGARVQHGHLQGDAGHLLEDDIVELDPTDEVVCPFPSHW